MSFEVLVGLNVTDDRGYQTYRDKITPLLEESGGGFRYDFKIAETLKNEQGRPINRLFAIYFKDKAAMDRFFTDEEYQGIKRQHYEPSVSATTIISQYERP